MRVESENPREASVFVNGLPGFPHPPSLIPFPGRYAALIVSGDVSVITIFAPSFTQPS